jgi:hypothetical protein
MPGILKRTAHTASEISTLYPIFGDGDESAREHGAIEGFQVVTAEVTVFDSISEDVIV